MKAVLLVAALLCRGGDAVTPVQKVIQMLNGMLEKGKEEKHSEQVNYAAYSQFCSDTEAEKTKEIETMAMKIELATADIAAAEADTERLTQEIQQLDADTLAWTADEKAATKVRGIEHTDYTKTFQDYTESINALDQAIAYLKERAKNTPQATALLEKGNYFDKLPKVAKQAIQAFLAQDPADDGLDVTAPEAMAYEFQSNSIIDMLEKLKDKFVEERTSLEKEEMNKKHAYDVLIQDLKASIAAADDSRATKATASAKSKQIEAEAKSTLQDSTATKEEDEKYLSDLKSTCSVKAQDFESRQTLRAEEIEALEKAIEILSADTVSGAADKHLPALLQHRKRSLAQLRSTAKADPSQNPEPNQIRVAAYLHEQAARTNSEVLSSLSVRVQVDPFEKVKKMIQDLIVRLEAEATEETQHKAWCDEELATNEQTRETKTAEVETLHAEIEGLEAAIAHLGQEVADLTQAVAESDAAVAKATELRTAEKTKNEATVADAQEAQVAVAQAITVLKDFYAKAAEATALVQQPDTFTTAYKGMEDSSSGVISMLEVIQSDFARLESETSSAEATAEELHQKFLSDSAVDKATKEQDILHKGNEKTTKEQTLTEKKADLDTTQNELTAANEYYEQLKPSCINTGMTYEERVAKREEEIQALQEALKILNGEDIAALQES